MNQRFLSLLKFRELNWKADKKQLSGFEASFTTNFIYRVKLTGVTAKITKVKLRKPLQKIYLINKTKKEIKKADFCVVCEQDKKITGFAYADFQKWNNSVLLQGIYVLPQSKNKGVGTLLLEKVLEYARSTNATRLRLETQNINVSAIDFYLKSEFQFCGFDNCLYDESVFPNETAFYFCRYLK